MIVTVSTFFIDHLIEMLLGFVVSFNVAAYTLLWRKVEENKEETQKNSETLTMVLNRMFGLEQDPTDEGHIMETKERFDQLADMVETIAEKQDEACKERKEEHEKVRSKMDSIMRVLAEEEKIEVDESDFK